MKKDNNSVSPILLIILVIMLFVTFDLYTKGEDSLVMKFREGVLKVEPIQRVVTPNISDILKAEDESLKTQLNTDMYYAYIHLNEEEQRLYRQIYNMLIEHNEKTEVLCDDRDVAEKVYMSVLNDNPEIFYTEGYMWMDRQQSMDSILGQYMLSEEDIAEHQQRIDKEVEKILANAPNGDDYEKVKYLYEYLVQTTEYDLSAPYLNGVISVFENHRTVCNGYTKAFQYLCKRLDIPCAFISGEADGAWGWDKHAWNMVKLDGDWYFVDVTWGDASFMSNPTQFINHTYLCATTEDISTTHQIDMPYKIEECTAVKDNYYQREGLYFTNVDGDKLQRIFTTTEGTVYELKCATPKLCRELKYYLVDEYKIYSYLKVYSGYSVNEEDNILLILK